MMMGSWLARLAMAVLLVVLLGATVCEAASPSVVSISGGYANIFTVLSDGTVWWWGNNNPVPEQMSGLTDVKEVGIWLDGCVALKNDGTVWIGYYNGSQPTRLSQLSDVRQISDGSVLKNDGTVWVWHSYRNLKAYDQPVQVPGLTDMVFIDTCVGVRSDGTVWEWGVTRDSEYWDRSDSDDLTPVQVPIDNVKVVFYVQSFGVALKNDGTVWTWGTNANGELGNGKRDDKYYSTPARVDGLSDVTAISSGQLYCLAGKSDGSLWGWGNDRGLELGIVPVTFVTRPVRLTLISDIDRFYAVGATSFVVKKDGSLWSWGQNCLGQVGDGTINDPTVMDLKSHGKDTPVKVLLDTTSGNPTVVPTATTTSTPVPSSSSTPVPSSSSTPVPTVSPVDGSITPSPTRSVPADTPVASQASGLDFATIMAIAGLACICSVLYSVIKKVLYSFVWVITNI